MKLSAVPTLRRAEIAEKISAKQNWSKLGLCFESRYQWKRTTQELKSKLGAHVPDVELCKQLIEDLVNLDVSLGEFIAALSEIGLISDANDIRNEFKDDAEIAISDQHINLLILTAPAYKALIERKLKSLSFFLHAVYESKALWIYDGKIKWYALILEYGENKATAIAEEVQYASDVLCIGNCYTKTFRGVEMIAEIQPTTTVPFKMSFTNKTKNQRVHCSAQDIDTHLIDALTYIETSCFRTGTKQSSAIGCVVRSRQSIKDCLTSCFLNTIAKIKWIGKFVTTHSSVDELKIQTCLEKWIGTAQSFVQQRLYIAFKFDISTVSVEDAKQMVSQRASCATNTVGANGSVVVFVETPLYYAWELSLTAHQLFESFKREDVVLRQISHLTIEEVDKAIERKDNEPYVMELKEFKMRMEQYDRRAYDHPLKFVSSDIIVMTDSIVCYTLNKDNLEEFIRALEVNDTVTRVSIRQCLLHDVGVFRITKQLEHLKSFQTFELMHAELDYVSTHCLIGAFNAISSLTSVTLTNVKVTNWKDLLSRFHYIKVLDLQQNNIEDHDIPPVLSSSITELNLKQNCFTNCLGLIYALKSNGTLKKINLAQNGISYIGPSYIFQYLIGNSSLTQLDLSDNIITHAFRIRSLLSEYKSLHMDLRNNLFSQEERDKLLTDPSTKSRVTIEEKAPDGLLLALTVDHKHHHKCQLMQIDFAGLTELIRMTLGSKPFVIRRGRDSKQINNDADVKALKYGAILTVKIADEEID